MMKTIPFYTTLLAWVCVPVVWANTHYPNNMNYLYQKGSSLPIPDKTTLIKKKVAPVQNVPPKEIPVYRAQKQEIDHKKINQLADQKINHQKGTPISAHTPKTVYPRTEPTVAVVKPSTPTPQKPSVQHHIHKPDPFSHHETLPPIPENGQDALNLWIAQHYDKSYTPARVATVAPPPQPKPVEFTKTQTHSSPLLTAKNALGATIYPKSSTKPQEDYTHLVVQAENHATGSVKNILKQARIMTLYNKEIIQGGCWDYLDTAWTRAGISRNLRKTVFRTERQAGNYAATDDLRAGDWLYHINYSYKNIEHSGMFIAWVDKSKNLGLTLSYAGEGRQEPARYKVYDLSGVYHITRPKI